MFILGNGEMRGKANELVGVDDKRQIAALFCGTMVGDFLPMQLVYKERKLSSSFCFPIVLAHHPLSKPLVNRGDHAAVHRARNCALRGEDAKKIVSSGNQKR